MEGRLNARVSDRMGQWVGGRVSGWGMVDGWTDV